MATEKYEFKVLWEEAVTKYEKSIGRTLSGPLIEQLGSPENLAKHVEGEHEKFIDFRRRSKLARRLKGVAKPIVALSTVAESALGLSPFAPASAIFGAIVYLVQATSGVSDAYDWIDDLFNTLGEANFAIRLSEYCENGVHPHLRANIIEILGCLLEILAISEKAIRAGRWKRYAKVVFSGADDPVKAAFDRLAKLLGTLDGLVLTIDFATNQRVEKKTGEILDIVKRSERNDLLDWLSPTDFQTRQVDALDRKEEDTGQWFVDSPEFNRWVGGPKQILFCPGMPGAGKTMMAAIAIDQLVTQVRNESNAVVFFYCSYKTTVDKNATAVLAALLRQLVQARPLIPEHVYELYKAKSASRSKLSSKEVLSTLQLVMKDYSKIHVVVDALDECKDERGSRPQLLNKLHLLQNEADLRIMITSRFTSEVEKEFGKVPTLEVRASKEDVRKFVAGQTLPDCITEDEDLHNLVTDKIVDAAEGMFLLARLYVNSFLNTIDESQVEEALEKISKTSGSPDETYQVYDQAYDDAIERIESQMSNQIELARKALSWIKDAQRPLTVEELRTALAVRPGDKELNQKRIPKIEVVVSVCAGIVTVDEKSNTVQLVHYTTQEYFERKRLGWNVGAQEEIATTCLTYLSFNTFKNGSTASDEDFEKRITENVFFDYSAHHWSEHVRPVQKAISNLALAFLTDDTLVDSNIQGASMTGHKFYSYSERFPRLTKGLHLTVMYGLLHLTELLIGISRDGKVDVDSQDEFGRTPLSHAAENGHEAVIKLLLDTSNADADSKDEAGRTPLSYAARYGHETIVRLLIDTGRVDANLPDTVGVKPLSYAAASGNEAIVRLLLNTGSVDVDSKDAFNRTALSVAAFSGHEATFKLLLDTSDTYAGLKDTFGRTPLSYAAENGHEAIVKLLLKTSGVDADSKDEDGLTPLSYAARNGHETIVRLLLDHNNVDANSKDKGGRTPLSSAAENGHEAIVKLLLDTSKVDADAASEDKLGRLRTPLSYAAENGQEAIVKLLLDTGNVDADWKDQYDRTPLSYAAKNGHETIVRQLLDIGNVDADSKDSFIRTPLSYAAENGNEAIVKLLLDTGKVNADLRNEFGRTALSYAVDCRYDAIVKLLESFTTS